MGGRERAGIGAGCPEPAREPGVPGNSWACWGGACRDSLGGKGSRASAGPADPGAWGGSACSGRPVLGPLCSLPRGFRKPGCLGGARAAALARGEGANGDLLSVAAPVLLSRSPAPRPGPQPRRVCTVRSPRPDRPLSLFCAFPLIRESGLEGVLRLHLTLFFCWLSFP